MCCFRWCGRQLCLRDMPISGVNSTARPTAVYASDPASPRRPQDSLPPCLLGFGRTRLALASSYRLLLSHPAPGSCQRSNAIEVRGFGGPCTPNPQARSFGYTPYPALSPGRALLLAFPPAGRLPSTISATDLWSALFEASQVLCSRPTPHPSRDGFASSASRRGPAPP